MTVPVRASLVLAAVLAAGPGLQAQTTLKYKFKAGDKLNYDLTISSRGMTRADDKEFPLLEKQVISMSWLVDSVDAKGVAKIRIKFERVKLVFEQPKVSLEVTSDAKEVPEKDQAKMMHNMAKLMSKIEGTVTMTPQGDIKNVTVPASALKEMRSIPGAEKLEEGWAEGNLQSTLKDSTLSLPAEPIAKGKSLKTPVDGMSPYGKLTGEMEMIYRGKIAHGDLMLDLFEIAPKLKIEPDPKAKPPITIKKYETEGTAYFDNDAGRLVESSMTQNIEVQTEVMGKTFLQKTEITNTLKLVK